MKSKKIRKLCNKSRRMCMETCEINRYNRLIEKYNNVLDYACNYEEELEKDILLYLTGF